MKTDNCQIDPYGNSGYCLSLTGSFKWNLVSDPLLRPWLHRLASIMELEPGVDGRSPLILFKTKRADGKGNLPCMKEPGDGGPPHVYDCGNLRVIHRVPGDVEIEMDEEEDVAAGTLNMWNAMFPVYQKVAEQRGVAIHTGLAEFSGNGVLFAGASGTGKSTCCARLPGHWKRLCDDLTVVVRDHEGGYVAHPFPTWSDYLWGNPCSNTWNVQHASPLKAIFFLERATHDELVPIAGSGKAALLINGSAIQVYGGLGRRLQREQKRNIVRKIFENACDMARVIPAYVLRVSLTGRFWELIEKECF